jgi:hypothetical protein
MEELKKAIPGLLVLITLIIVAGLGNHFIDGLY